MVPWREASRPKMDQSHLSTSKTHRPPTLEVRKAILETPAETDDRDSTSEPCRQIFTSHSLMCHVSSMAVTASSKRRRSRLCNAGRRQQHGNWGSPVVDGIGKVQPNTRWAVPEVQSSGPISAVHLSVRDHPWPLAQPIFPVVPRVETLPTLGPWNPGPGQERFCNLQKIKNTAPPAGSGGS